MNRIKFVLMALVCTLATAAAWAQDEVEIRAEPGQETEVTAPADLFARDTYRIQEADLAGHIETGDLVRDDAFAAFMARGGA